MKIAVIATVWFPLSHADVIVSRRLKSFPGDDRDGWTSGASHIASVYLDQTPSNDIGHAICRAFEVPIFSSIRDALTLGT